MPKKGKDGVATLPELRIALMNFLTYRPRTVLEARRKLSSLGADREASEYLVEENLDLGLLDDAKFADDFVDVRLRSKRHGRIRIKKDLRAKGISEVMANQAIEKHCSNELELVAARKAVPLRWFRQDGPISWEDRRKVIQALQRRGFSYGIAKEASKILDET